MPLTIIEGDIAEFSADALVNAANSRLLAGGGVSGALFERAGHLELQAACDAIGYCAPGQAVITPAFNLNAKHVIHTVGPMYHDGKQGEEEILRACYTNTLKLAAGHGLQSVAFPLIASGIYGYPRDAALLVATTAIRAFLNQQEEEMDVSLVLYDRRDLRLNRNLQLKIERFMRHKQFGEADQMRREHELRRHRGMLEQSRMSDAFFNEVTEEEEQFTSAPSLRDSVMEAAPRSLEELIGQMDESFADSLLRIIDSKGMTDPEVYKRANLDRRHFAKIRNIKGYTPTKQTILALAIALKLSLPETRQLLAKAGYALSGSQRGDVIIAYFIEHRQYSIDSINAVLFSYDQALLGA